MLMDLSLSIFERKQCATRGKGKDRIEARVRIEQRQEDPRLIKFTSKFYKRSPIEDFYRRTGKSYESILKLIAETF